MPASIDCPTGARVGRTRRFLVAVLCLVCASAAMAEGFPVPIALPQEGAALAVAQVRLATADRDYFVTGNGGGFLTLTRFNPSSQFYTQLQRLFVGGQVTSVVPWLGNGAPPVGLVAATANPDRILLVRIAETFPYLVVSDTVDLAEDPGRPEFVGALPAGPQELAVPLPGVDRVAFLQRQVSGLWTVAGTTDTGDDPSSAVGVDLDGDGVRELVVSQTGALSRTLGILRRQPDASYALETVTLPGIAPSLVAAYDLDGDGTSELAVAAADVAAVVFYSGQSGGLVERDRTDLTNVAQAFHLTPLADGTPALFAANAERGLVEYATFDQGMWQHRETYYPGCRPWDFDLADVDGDGRDDLVSVGGVGNVLTTMIGNEQGGFAGFPALSLDRDPGAFVVADLDGDGWDDLLVSDINETSLSLVRGRADGSLNPVAETVALGFRPGSVLAVDFDADPALELAVLDVVAGELVVLDAVGSPAPVTLSRTPVGTFPYFMTAADLDGDLAQDLLVLSPAAPEVAILYGHGDGTVEQTVLTGFGNVAHWLAALDLNGDGLLDLAGADGNSRVWTLTNSGGRQFGDGSFVNAGSGALFMATGDLDGDLDDDLVVANRSENTVSFFEADGSGALVRRIGGHALDGQPAGIVLADFNRNGRLDVLANLKNDGALALVVGVANWSYSLPVEITASPAMSGIGAVDFDRDGAPDILVLDSSLLLGMVIVNDTPGQVAVAPTALRADCSGEQLLLRVRPDRPGPWSLALGRQGSWRTVMRDGRAAVGRLDLEGDTWLLRLSGAELAGWLAGTTGNLAVRLTVGETPDREQEVRTLDLPCVPAAAPAATLVWHREPWPNPFNPVVSATVALGRPGPLRAAVYDLAGRAVALLAEGEFAAGTVPLRWDGQQAGQPVAAGVYLLRVESPTGLLQHKLMLLK